MKVDDYSKVQKDSGNAAFKQLGLIDMCGIFPAFNQFPGFVMHTILMNFSFSEAEVIKQN